VPGRPAFENESVIRRSARHADARRGHPAGGCRRVFGRRGRHQHLSGAIGLADQVGAIGPVDAVIHNARVGYGGSPRPTADGFPDIFAVNVLAPYVLTARINGSKRLVYLSSSMHRVSPNLHDITTAERQRRPEPNAFPLGATMESYRRTRIRLRRSGLRNNLRCQ
jgi:NAD(P)-dependent dehydrogenase (short-subunit alcohol dehydrogenase family)